jgi:tetratricopeptide (TPR) repeat protein
MRRWVILGWVGLMWGQSAAASEAVMRFRMGQYEAALPLFQQAYRQTGDKLWASYLLECYLRLENYEAAERWLSQQKKSRSTPDIWLKVWEGRYLLAKGDSAGGLALWESTLKIPQADTHIYEDLAEVAARVWGRLNGSGAFCMRRAGAREVPLLMRRR